MAKVPDKISDYAIRHPEYVQPADHQTAVLPALIEGICDVIQEALEDNICTLIETNNVSDATGALLDFWGELVDEPRNSRTDEVYRTSIRAKIRRNLSSGTADELIDIVRSLYGDSAATVILTESPPSEVRIEVQSVVGSLDMDQVFFALDKVRAAGVRLHLEFWPSPKAEQFRYSASGTLEPAATTGYNQGKYIGVKRQDG